MEILSYNDRQEFLDYLPRVKTSPKDWQFIEIALMDNSGSEWSVTEVAKLTQALFPGKEGKIFICNGREILMLIREGKAEGRTTIADIIVKALPEGKLKVRVHEINQEGIVRIEIMMGRHPPKPVSFTDIRAARKENVVLVADDDMYMRLLIKKGMPAHITVHEVVNGGEVIENYKKYVPNMVFLDIHLPGQDGTEILKHLLSLDKDAYVIMLSADSSRENVEFTARLGTKGFLAKPFARDRLLEFVSQCPTIA